MYLQRIKCSNDTEFVNLSVDVIRDMLPMYFMLVYYSKHVHLVFFVDNVAKQISKIAFASFHYKIFIVSKSFQIVLLFYFGENAFRKDLK